MISLWPRWGEPPMWAQVLSPALGAEVLVKAQPSFRMERRLNFCFFFFSLENITGITILWGGIIKCKLAYRLVLGGREKERWAKIFKIMYSYATQRGPCRNLPGRASLTQGACRRSWWVSADSFQGNKDKGSITAEMRLGIGQHKKLQIDLVEFKTFTSLLFLGRDSPISLVRTPYR